MALLSRMSWAFSRNVVRTTVSTRLFATLEEQIKQKGDEIRALKAEKADAKVVASEVEKLLALKGQLDPSLLKKPKKKQKQQKQHQQQKTKRQNDDSDFITAREDDYSKWYSDIIRTASLAESSPVRGCMVIQPWGMAVWDKIRTHLDAQIQEHGASNAYFPLLIPQSFLAKEADHVDGFAKECAIVTHHRLMTNEDGELVADPESKLEDPLVIRPTSETMIWQMFRKWIVSHRDLPLKVNQWANVLRWEMRTRPFLRTSEFLWQEGHTAHATAESADDDARTMMRRYAELAEDLLAMPVVCGCKSPSERFAGAAETYTIEALMPNGWALQSGTSHFLGQSFGKAFEVTFQSSEGTQEIVWGTSWGVSTRLVGALIMTHSDNKGLVLPPKVAPHQVVIMVIPSKEPNAEVDAAVEYLKQDFKEAGIRCHVDNRDYLRIGAKTYEWERKGVPLRVEVGPRDVDNEVCVFKYRAGPGAEEKAVTDLSKAASTATAGLAEMQQNLFQSAQQRLEEGTRSGVSYDEMKALLEPDEASSFPGQGLFLVPWKCNAENEDAIQQECKATIRCYPLKENEEGLWKGQKCFYSGEDATHMALFGRAF